MKYGSVCSGIEAASVAWEGLGWSPAWFSEIEAFPNSVLKHHYPNVENLGDMRNIANMVRDGFVSAPDALVGGTPCQAFSIAGLRNSLDDARGQLTISFVDLANAIDSTRLFRGERESIVLWENVPGVLNTRDNAFGCFLAALAGENEELQPSGKKWPNAGCVFGPQRTIAWRVLDAQYFGVAQRRRRVLLIASARDDINPAEILFEFGGLRRDFAPSRKTKQEIAGTIKSSAGRRGGIQDECGDGLVPVISKCLTRKSTEGVNLDFETSDFIVSTYAGNVESEVAATLQTTCDDYSRADSFNLIAFDSRQECVSSPDVFGTLSSSSPQAQSVAGITGVRRLTPVECARLQGFPDHYLDILHRKKPAADGNKYKSLGNSMAAPKMKWLGERIDNAINLNKSLANPYAKVN